MKTLIVGLLAGFAFLANSPALFAQKYAPAERPYSFDYKNGKDMDEGEIILIVQYQVSNEGDMGALLRGHEMLDFSQVAQYSVEVLVWRITRIKDKVKSKLKVRITNPIQRPAKLKSKTDFPVEFAMSDYKNDTKQQKNKLEFTATASGVYDLGLPVLILDQESGDTLGNTLLTVKLNNKGVVKQLSEEEILCAGCKTNYDSCFLLLKTYPNTPCAGDAKNRIAVLDDNTWSKCAETRKKYPDDLGCLRDYVKRFDIPGYTARHLSEAQTLLKPKQVDPVKKEEKRSQKKEIIPEATPELPPFSIKAGNKRSDGKIPIMVLNALKPRYKDISWDEGLKAEWSSNSTVLLVDYPHDGGVYGLLVCDSLGRRDSILFEDNALEILLKNLGDGQYRLQFVNGLPPFRIKFADNQGNTFTADWPHNRDYNFSEKDLLAAGLQGVVSIGARDLDDLTDRVAPEKIQLPLPPDYSIWYLLAAIALAALALVFLQWRRKKETPRTPVSSSY